MKNRQKSALKKNANEHFVEVHTSHFEDENIEIANEFFDEGFVQPLDSTSTLADNLTKKIKKDFQT